MIWGLHGAVGMAEDWDVFGEIQGVDLWSFLKEGEMSLDEAGQKVAEMASDGDTLVGYSMGGRIALHALGKRQWKKVIIVSAHPGLESAHQERLKNDECWGIGIDFWRNGIPRECFPAQFRIGEIAFVCVLELKKSPGVFAAGRWGLSGVLKSLRARLLGLWGRETRNS